MNSHLFTIAVVIVAETPFLHRFPFVHNIETLTITVGVDNDSTASNGSPELGYHNKTVNVHVYVQWHSDL